MIKDIFIDNCVIPKFANPANMHYKALIEWLLEFDENDLSKNAYLAVSKKVLGEYKRSLRNCFYNSNFFVMIIDQYTRKGRFNPIKNYEIRTFKQKHFKKHVKRKLRCNTSDREHIPVVMLSDRKYALSLDINLCWDINNFPGFSALASQFPEKIPYRN